MGVPHNAALQLCLFDCLGEPGGHSRRHSFTAGTGIRVPTPRSPGSFWMRGFDPLEVLVEPPHPERARRTRSGYTNPSTCRERMPARVSAGLPEAVEKAELQCGIVRHSHNRLTGGGAAQNYPDVQIWRRDGLCPAMGAYFVCRAPGSETRCRVLALGAGGWT